MVDNGKLNYTIFSQRLAGRLMAKGYPLLGLGKDPHDENKHVFFFRNSDQIRAEIESFKRK